MPNWPISRDHDYNYIFETYCVQLISWKSIPKNAKNSAFDNIYSQKCVWFFWLIKLNIIFVPYFLRMWWSYSPVRGCWFWLSCAVCRANTFYLARLQAVFMYRKIIFLSPMGVSPPHSICGFFVCQKKGQILNLGFQKSVPSVACDIFYKFP